METTELASLLRSSVSNLHKTLRKQMYSEVSYSMTEMETIGLLAKNPYMLPTELASLTRIKTQSMSQILNKLEGQGVIKRIPSKEDKRKVFISLTSQGKKMVDKIVYDRDLWLKAMIERNLNEKEKEILVKALPVINKLMEKK